MKSQVPAATRTLRVLRYLAGQPDPVPLDSIIRACDLPRSTAYHLINVMVDEGWVLHLREDSRFALGPAASEMAGGYARQAPLARIARKPLSDLTSTSEQNAHLAVLHGRDVLYVIEERAAGQPSLITDVGVRLPAHLTASGRAMLADLPAAQIRALYPDGDAFVTRHGSGPSGPSALRRVLSETRRRGYAVETGEVTPGFCSVAAAVHDHSGLPVAGLAITYAEGLGEPAALVAAVRSAADRLTRRLGGTVKSPDAGTVTRSGLDR